MARIIDKPITVTLGADRQPRWFTWRKHRYEVSEILEDWKEVGEWWNAGNLDAAELTTYRVQTRGGGVFELTYHQGLKVWKLYKVYD